MRVVVVGDVRRPARGVLLEHRLDRSVLVLGVLDEQADGALHLVGEGGDTAVVGRVQAAGVGDEREQLAADALVDVAVEVERHRSQAVEADAVGGEVVLGLGDGHDRWSPCESGCGVARWRRDHGATIAGDCAPKNCVRAC